MSKVCKSVHKSSATITSNYQNQQASKDSLKNIVTSLLEKSAQVILHLSLKFPPGLPHRNILYTPFLHQIRLLGFTLSCLYKRQLIYHQHICVWRKINLALYNRANFHLFLSVVQQIQICVRYWYFKLTAMVLQINHKYLQLQPSHLQFILLTQLPLR